MQEYGEFIVKIIKTLSDHGYPAKRVSLPLERMYALAHAKGLNFNKVLSFLQEKNIGHEKTEEKVIFSPITVVAASPSAADRDGRHPPSPEASSDGQPEGAFAGVKDFGAMMSKAQEFMKDMSPADLARVQAMVETMTPEQRQDLWQQAQKMFKTDK